MCKRLKINHDIDTSEFKFNSLVKFIHLKLEVIQYELQYYIQFEQVLLYCFFFSSIIILSKRHQWQKLNFTKLRVLNLLFSHLTKYHLFLPHLCMYIKEYNTKIVSLHHNKLKHKSMRQRQCSKEKTARHFIRIPPTYSCIPLSCIKVTFITKGSNGLLGLRSISL